MPPLPKRTRMSNARAPQAICCSTVARWHRAKGCKRCIYHRRTGYAVRVLCEPYMVLFFWVNNKLCILDYISFRQTVFAGIYNKNKDGRTGDRPLHFYDDWETWNITELSVGYIPF